MKMLNKDIKSIVKGVHYLFIKDTTDLIKQKKRFWISNLLIVIAKWFLVAIIMIVLLYFPAILYFTFLIYHYLFFR